MAFENRPCVLCGNQNPYEYVHPSSPTTYINATPTSECTRCGNTQEESIKLNKYMNEKYPKGWKKDQLKLHYIRYETKELKKSYPKPKFKFKGEWLGCSWLMWIILIIIAFVVLIQVTNNWGGEDCGEDANGIPYKCEDYSGEARH